MDTYTHPAPRASQECLDVAAFAVSAHDAVGGAAHYVLYQRSIGSAATSLGYHGFIALLVLVARPRVESGDFSEVPPTMPCYRVAYP